VEDRLGVGGNRPAQKQAGGLDLFRSLQLPVSQDTNIVPITMTE
jgi:hypothetical protein